MSVWKAVSYFAGGILTGSAGFSILGSKDAKKAYTRVVAAALRCKECTMEKATLIKENTDDILAEARKINEERAASVEVIEEAGQ